MKAEHRKELQTNALADRLGRLLQNVKSPPKKSSVLYWLLAIVLVAGVVGFFIWRSRGGTATAKNWEDFESGDPIASKALLDSRAKTAAGKAERFQLAWSYLWDGVIREGELQERVGGIKFLMSDPIRAVISFERARKLYTDLADECKDDEVLGAEAVYSLAVIEETLAAAGPLYDRAAQLDKALRHYRDVVEKFPIEKFPKNAFAAEASQRVKDLKDDNKRREIGTLYETLNTRIFAQLLAIQMQMKREKQ